MAQSCSQRLCDGVQGLQARAVGGVQVVSDYLTPYDGEMRMMRSNNQAVVVYSYRMRFWRDPSKTPSLA